MVTQNLCLFTVLVKELARIKMKRKSEYMLQVKFDFLLFFSMLLYDNKYQTMENQI